MLSTCGGMNKRMPRLKIGEASARFSDSARVGQMKQRIGKTRRLHTRMNYVLHRSRGSPHNYEWNFENPGRALLRTLNPEEADHLITSGEIWEHAHFGRMEWDKIATHSSFKDVMKAYVFHVLESQSPRSGFRCFAQLLAIHRSARKGFGFPIKRAQALGILSALDDPQLFTGFRRFYRWAVGRAIPGFERTILREMERLRPPKEHRRVDPRDPLRYLTNDEERVLLECFQEAPSTTDPQLRNHVLTQLCWELGCRTEQARSIEESNLHRISTCSGEYFSLDLRRAKQRIVVAEYKQRAISNELGEKMLLLIQQNRSMLGPSLPSSPVFCTHPRINISTKHCGQRLNSDTASRAVADFLAETLESEGYRGANVLRHNMAQRLADIGASAEIIAEALDHSDISNVLVYVRARAGIAAIKTRALGKSETYHKILDWLNGRKPVPSTDATPNAKVQGIVADRYIGNIGACGLPGDKWCPKNPVFSCYGCSQFTPFLDGNHAAVADAMTAENTRLIQIAGAEGNRTALANEYPIAVARAVQKLCDRANGISDAHARTV
jgi:site-specific recombinase XerD